MDRPRRPTCVLTAPTSSDLCGRRRPRPRSLTAVQRARLRDNVAAVRGRLRGEAPAPRACSSPARRAPISGCWTCVRDAGANVEVNSGGELDKALRAGFAPSQIVFNGVAKTTRRDRRRTCELGVRALLVDSLCELERIAAVAAGSELHERRVAPRIDVHVPALTHPGLETAYGGKAGIDRDDAAEAFRRGRRIPVARAGGPAPARGLADHQRRAVPAGDGRRPSTSWPRSRARPACACASSTPAAASPCRMRRPDPSPAALHRGCASLRGQPGAGVHLVRGRTRRRALLRLRGDARRLRGAVCAPLLARRPDLALFLEPGRSIAATTGVLVTRVESEKTKRTPRRAAGRVIGGAALAHHRRRLQHAARAHQLRLVLPPSAAAPASRRRSVPARRPALRRRRRVRRRRRHAVPPVPGRHRRWATSSCSGTRGGYTLEMMNDYNARPRAAAYAVTSPARSWRSGGERRADAPQPTGPARGATAPRGGAAAARAGRGGALRSAVTHCARTRANW